MIELLPAREIALIAGPIHITWYGVMYVLGFLIALYLLPRLQKHRNLNYSKDQWLEIVTWSALGVLAGGRLGYALFYEPELFSNLGQLIAIWDGGMSAHGGMIGVGVALWLHLMAFPSLRRRGGTSVASDGVVLKVLDVAVVPVAIGLALGRVGNWINQEIFLSSGAYVFVIFKELFIAGICYWYLKTTPSPPSAETPLLRKEGEVLAIFLILYAILRFISEYWRSQPWPGALGLSRGQLLTLPVLVVGLMLLRWLKQKRQQ